MTQEGGTEPAVRNEYWDNKQPGIYVDAVSGGPLFASVADLEAAGYGAYRHLFAPAIKDVSMTRSATPGNGELVAAADMPSALTAATLVFGDGATQVFTADGHTSYVEQGRPTTGEWSVVSDGRFSSFWPPDYRATYTVRWIVEGSSPTGLSFTEDGRGQRFDGRYRPE